MIHVKVIEAGGHKPPSQRKVLQHLGEWPTKLPVVGSVITFCAKQYRVKQVPVPELSGAGWPPVTYNGKPMGETPEFVLYLEEVN